MKEDRRLTRREMLAMVAGIGGFATASSVTAQVAKREFTQSLVLGPFYPQIKPLDQDADLTMVKGQKIKADGKIIHVAGRVITVAGEPVRNARIEIWQADTNGHYLHNSDPNKAPLDKKFQGYCVLKTDKEGRYRFKTVKPGAYPGMRAGIRTPHIHFDVQAKTDRIVTQVFFPGEKLNETDTILQSIRNESAKKTVFLRELTPPSDIGPNETLFGWDCVLLTG